MTDTWSNQTFRLQLHLQGAKRYEKVSYPHFCGTYTQLEGESAILHFNGNNEIIRARGKSSDWPHPNEWLKRSLGNDWIYYSTGGYTGVFEAIGEYYLPNLPYPTNNLLGGKPLQDPRVQSLLGSWYTILQQMATTAGGASPAVVNFFSQALANDELALAEKSRRLFALYGERPSVLPPDTRHVDYQVLPVNIATGCLYKCRFCEVKNRLPFTRKSWPEITRQLTGLSALVADDLPNYNALFLGDHDALQAGPQCILDTIAHAYRDFAFAESLLSGCFLFLFASVASLANTPDSFFNELAGSPYMTYINLGLESADQETLDFLGKPITARQVHDTFARIRQINERYPNVEISVNFLFDDHLPAGHYPAFLQLVRDSLPHQKVKGAVYLSPLRFDQPSRLQTFTFHRLKMASRLPTFLYIIQRI